MALSRCQIGAARGANPYLVTKAARSVWYAATTGTSRSDAALTAGSPVKNGLARWTTSTSYSASRLVMCRVVASETRTCRYRGVGRLAIAWTGDPA